MRVRFVFVIGIPFVVPDPELLAICRLVLAVVQVGEDVDDFAGDVDFSRLLCFVSIADGFWKEIGEGTVLHVSWMLKDRFRICS